MSKTEKPQIDKFKPQRVNANKHNPRGMKALDDSILQDGWIGAITTAADGETFDGSARLETLQQGEGADPIVVEIDGTRPVILKRLDIANADDPKAQRLAIAANRVAELNLDWDADILAELSQEIDLTGLWSDEELSNLLASSQESGEGSGEEDEEEVSDLIDEAESGAIESRVSLGQIWKLGRHTIACGDSTSESNVKKLLGDRTVSLCHADPPYGMGKEKDGVLNDNLYREKLDAFQMQWWKACRSSLTDNGSVYIWGNAEDLWRLWYVGGLKVSERSTFRNEIIWNKESGQGMLSDQHRMFPTASERCLFFMLGEQGFNNNADMFWDGWKEILNWLKEQKTVMKWTASDVHQILGVGDKGGGLASHYFGESQWMLPTRDHYLKLQQAASGKAFKREYDDLKREWYATRAYFDNTHDSMTDVWSYPRVQGEERWSHATPKPVDMISRIYKSSSPDDSIIYSPFLGSGTDVIAAQQMEGTRSVIGFELSPEYCEVICRRFESLTGINAELAGNLTNG